MAHTTHVARITGPVAYIATGGRKRTIPIGPCIVEKVDGQFVAIVWGARAQNCAPLRPDELVSAEDLGHLVLLD